MNTLAFPTNKLPIRAQAVALIKRVSFRQGTFTLSSGKASDYYLDMKPTMLNPKGSYLLATLVLERIHKANADCVGGLEMGAVPLISPIAMLSDQTNKPVDGFFVRKNIKDHGTMKKIEGIENFRGRQVAILDDVMTTGGSAMKAIEAIKEAGGEIVLVLSIVDREEGAREFYEKKGLPFEALFTAREFLTANSA
jgi:orotate phosphoribosyltransferase